MNLILIFICYQILQILLFPFFILYLGFRWFKKKPVLGSLKERLGIIPKTILFDKNTKVIWIHAVSVGEILSIQHLVDQIKKEIPNLICYLTTGTIAGKKIAKENINCDYISFLPYDFLPTISLAFKRIKPTSIIIIEAETWPNFLMLSKFFKINAYSLNARISQRSKNRYLKLKFIFKNLLEIFQIIFVQSQQDKENFQKLGIHEEKLKVLGNIKSLNVLVKKEKMVLESPNLFSFKPKYKILLVGSIHPGELDIYLNLFKRLKNQFSDLKMILAPRHFNWQEELIKKTPNNYLWDNSKNISFEFIAKKVFEQTDILLVCKLGELFKLYQFADIFYLGGTFVPVGGHNLLEPAVWAKPTIIGPYFHNCKDIADKLENENALIKVKKEEELLQKTLLLLQNLNLLESMGKNSFNWLKNDALIVEKNLNTLINKLKYLSH